MSPDEVARRGDEAARVLEEKVVREALEAIRDEIISQWANTPARDTEGREWVWRHYKVVEKFEGMLRGYIESGRMAKIEMAEKERLTDRFKRWVA